MKRLIKKLKNKKGFTLVESIVATGVLAIASIIFATFISTTVDLTRLTLQNEKDYRTLQEAVSLGAKEGDSITVVTEEYEIDPTTNEPKIDPETKEKVKKSFTIDFDANTHIKVKGKYVIVENTLTKQHFVVFVGENFEKSTNNPPKAEEGGTK